MNKNSKLGSHVLKRPFSFLLQVLRAFKRNQGLLLSGAVAYYTLLSIIPLFALILVGLSHFISEEKLFHTIITNLQLVIPSHTEKLAGQLQAFLENRNLVGGIGILVMLFFSSTAFSVLEGAMAVIFSHRGRVHRRHFLISAIIPYAYILLLALGIVLVSIIRGALETIETRQLAFLHWSFRLEGATVVGLYLIGLVGQVLMFASLYLVMPVGHTELRYALAGAIFATVLWEITRHILVWYYANLSIVNIIYGSLATAVVALLSIEFAAIILLLGAQFIAEFECRTNTLYNENASAVDI
jgi:membrane protein